VSLWVTLFFATISTVYVLRGDTGAKLIKYYVVQEILSWFVLISLVLESSGFMCVALALKLGFPPLHN
jgi:hypothetical protein